jgi:ApaG protein
MNKITKSNKISGLDDVSIDLNKVGLAESISNGIKITVLPEFIVNQGTDLGDLYIWSYKINIKNQRELPVKLLNRHWKIIDQNGHIQEVDGEGVVGKCPEINQGESFEYSSGVHLSCPSGIMSGHYEMRDENGVFKVEIPAFSLDAPSLNQVIN